MEPIWILKDVALAIHKMQIAEHGGADGIRDFNLLDSALLKAKNSFYYNKNSTIFELCADYAFGIIQNHPFVDGNKSTAFVTSMLFLKLNGYEVKIDQVEGYKIFISIAAGKINFKEFVNWIELQYKKSSTL